MVLYKTQALCLINVLILTGFRKRSYHVDLSKLFSFFCSLCFVIECWNERTNQSVFDIRKMIFMLAFKYFLCG